MKFIIVTCFLYGFFLTGCHSTSTIYIVRHAEKSSEPANDPHLTSEGKQRAETLKDLLKDKNIKRIFSTDKNRTIETATPLSRSLNLPIQNYGNDTLPRFLQGLIRSKKNTLVIGHSNTSIIMINSLHLPQTITYISEDDYDNLFIIKVKDGKTIKLTETTYGVISPKVK